MRKPEILQTEKIVQLTAEEIAEREHFNQLLSQPIEILELSTRAYNCLKEAEVNTIKELVSKTEEQLKSIRNLGEKSLEEIKEKLKLHNLFLGMKI